MRSLIALSVIIVVAALACPSLAAYDDHYYWDGPTGVEADWHATGTSSNWQFNDSVLGWIQVDPPTIVEYAWIDGGGVAVITQDADTRGTYPYGGHVIVRSGSLFGSYGIKVGYQNYTLGDSTLTQEGGTVTGSIGIGVPRGRGIYTIWGGDIGPYGSHTGASLRLGGNYSSGAFGRFVIDNSGDNDLAGTVPGSIVLTSYTQTINTAPAGGPEPSELVIILSADGVITPIQVTGTDAGSASLAGLLVVDDSNYANLGLEKITIPVVITPNAAALDYTGLSLDPTSLANKWVLGDDGNGTLTVSNVPEPASATVLLLGVITMIRRRKR